MRKPIWTAIIFLLTAASVFAQSDKNPDFKNRFKKENIFIGTGINLGIGGTSFNVGVNPEIGYSVANWLDAGVALNFNYFSQNANDYSPYRLRNFNYGAGPFLRIWPLSFLHVQVQPEFNWVSSSQKDVISNQTFQSNHNAASLLVGIGYGTRLIGSHYSYFTLMIDVLQDAYSPYRDQFNDPLPVLRAGFGFYLRGKHR